MIAASCVPVAARSWSRRSSRSTEPSAAALTTTTFIPAITAEAALVPCAEDGIRQIRRSLIIRDSWYARMASSPASSPWLPAFGWMETWA